jgi:hypothetical protein
MQQGHMIKLKSIIDENSITDTIASMAAPYLEQFAESMGHNASFSYLGLKNGEYVFVAPLTKFGDLRLIIAAATLVARINKDQAYFGIVYTLNGLEQFDATVCVMHRTKAGIQVKLFDDADADFSAANTKFAKLIKTMP